jgi:hypothetical protein
MRRTIGRPRWEQMLVGNSSVSIVPGLNSQNDVFVRQEKERFTINWSQGDVRRSSQALGGPSEPLKHSSPFWSEAHLAFSFQQFFSSTTIINPTSEFGKLGIIHSMSSLELQLSPTPLLAIKGAICYTCLSTASKLNKCGRCKRVSLVGRPFTLAHS